MTSGGHIRLACVVLMCVIGACSDIAQTPVSPSDASAPSAQLETLPSPFMSTPSLSEAVALQPISTEAPDTWRVRQASGQDSENYIAIIEMERPVSHHTYVYEQRRSGDWVATVWRRGDGSREELSYFNVRTGVGVHIRRNETGEIRGVTIVQSDDFIDDRRESTSEHATHLGERCVIWRTVPRPGPGFRRLYESCVTDDGIELWSRVLGTGHPTRPDYVRPEMQVSSLRRGAIDPDLARPRPEWFQWSFWLDRAAAISAPSADAPPDHTIWYEEQRTQARGRVIKAQYRNNWRAELSHLWFERGNSREYSLFGPTLRLHAQMDAGYRVLRRVSIDIESGPLRWRPDPANVTRGESLTILGRQCFWLTPRDPPHDAFWRDCWTDDGLVLARERHGRAGGSGEAAVRLDAAPGGALQPPREILDWVRQMSH